jgi:N-acetylglucosaminyldiphosphoundecaprenol N-acetyl-beta-D-mannosaminyltransferase
MRQPERMNLLGVSVDLVDMAGALRFVEEAIQGGHKGKVILAMNPEKVVTLQNRPDLKALFDQADLLIPDGIGLVAALRLLAGKKTTRVAGADLAQEICALAARQDYGVFLYGASEEVSASSASILSLRHPRLRIVGRCNGFVPADKMEQVIGQITRSKPDVIFVALGSPRQEEWVKQHLDQLDAAVVQCIGGTLDTIAGTVRRAPVFWQNLGLEWAYRLAREPRRILRQKALPLFVFQVIRQKLRLRS